MPHASHMAGSSVLFLKQLAHSFQELGWAKRTLASKYWESVLCYIEIQRCRPKCSDYCCFVPSSLHAKVTFRGPKGLASLPTSFILSFFPLGSQTLN